MSDPKARKHLLVVGTGSVGKRHLRNFAALGFDLSAMDPRADRLEEAKREVLLRHCSTDLEHALAAKAGFDGAVICSPPVAHVEQTMRCLQAGLPVLIEKPVSTSHATAVTLEEFARDSRLPVLLGYTYRWWPPLREVLAAVHAGEVGKVRHVRCVMGAHLADWHPWESYQDFFMASASLGGGALLDESHFLDLMLWFFGLPRRVFGKVERLSSLHIETDDNVDALLDYDDGLRVSIHLDLFGRPHEKSIRIVGETGTIEWTFEPNEIRIGRRPEADWDRRGFTCERNDMFVAVAREFAEVLSGAAQPSCTIADGVRVMKVIEAIRRSSQEGRVVQLSEIE